jgi:hypothetical protein
VHTEVAESLMVEVDEDLASDSVVDELLVVA